MLTPKASHLVERAAQRLLDSGALDNTAQQLLRPGGPQEAAPAPPAVERLTPDEQRPAEIPWADDSPAPLSPADLTNDTAGLAPQSTTLPPASPTGSLEAMAAVSAATVIRPDDPAGDTSPDQVASYTVDVASLERAGMVDHPRTRSRISEEFRLIQRQILRSAFGPGAEPGFSNLLMVTSARPGEGKSFTSINLAGSISRQGDNHVLLIDADSKRDSVCYNLGLSHARGLLDLAANPVLDPAAFIIRTPIARLSILPIGRNREGCAELFSSSEMTRLIQRLGRRYADRLLILDAPPCLSTSDPAVLAQVVGQILFVVEADRTQREEVEASLDLIQACPTITLALNKQQISARYTFGAYSSYYTS